MSRRDPGHTGKVARRLCGCGVERGASSDRPDRQPSTLGAATPMMGGGVLASTAGDHDRTRRCGGAGWCEGRWGGGGGWGSGVE